MARVEIRDVGAYGVILDTPAHELPSNAWSNIRNARALGTHIESMEGETQIFAGTEEVPLTPVTAPLNLFYCPTVAGIPLWVYAGTDKIGVFDATAGHVDITPASASLAIIDPFLWSGTWLNGVFLLNSRADEAMVWDTLDPNTPVLMQKMSEVTDTEFQDTWRFNSLRSFKEILIGIGFSDGAAEYPTTIKWSGPALPGTVPIFWDTANLNNIAGDRPLSATPGRCIDGMQLGNNFILCKEDATIVLTFAQGTVPVVPRYIDNNSGVLALNCMTEYSPGKMLILNQKFDVVVTEGNQVVSILEKKVKKYLQARIDPENSFRSYVVHNFSQKEVWICYPIVGTTTAVSDWILATGYWDDGGVWDDDAYWEDFPTGVVLEGSNLGCQEALIWNYVDNTFTFYDLGRMNAIAPGKVSEGVTVFAIDEIDTIIDDDSDIIDGGGVVGASQLVGCSFGRNAFFALDAGTAIDGFPMVSMLERKSLAVIGHAQDGSVRVDHQKVKIVESLWPTFEVQGVDITVLLSVGAQEFRDGPIVWDGPYEFIPGQLQEMDFLNEGIYITVRIEIPTTNFWKFHAYGLEIGLAGDML